MASKLVVSNNLCGSIAHFPAAVGSRAVYPGAGIGTLRLPTDPVGAYTLTLTNVVIGSRVVVRDQANTTTVYNDLASSSTVVIPMNVYAAGSPLNLLRVDVRKASADPFYQRYKTFITAVVGAASVYINQIPDQR